MESVDHVGRKLQNVERLRKRRRPEETDVIVDVPMKSEVRLHQLARLVDQVIHGTRADGAALNEANREPGDHRLLLRRIQHRESARPEVLAPVRHDKPLIEYVEQELLGHDVAGADVVGRHFRRRVEPQRHTARKRHECVRLGDAARDGRHTQRGIRGRSVRPLDYATRGRIEVEPCHLQIEQTGHHTMTRGGDGPAPRRRPRPERAREHRHGRPRRQAGSAREHESDARALLTETGSDSREAGSHKSDRRSSATVLRARLERSATGFTVLQARSK